MEQIHNTLDNVAKELKQDKSMKINKLTGFFNIDYALNQPSKDSLITIAARPAMGKTSFILNIATNLACIENKSVAIFSLENSKEQVCNRLLSSKCLVNYNSIKQNKFSDNEWENIVNNLKIVADMELYIDDTPNISCEEIRKKCLKLKNENNISFVLIDYLQLLRKNKEKNTCKSLKNLSKELNIPIIVTSQLSNKPDKRFDNGEDPRPILSDLNQEIINESDVIMFIYRDGYYNFDSMEYDIAEINIAKNRHGNTGIVKMKYQSEYLKYQEIEKKEQYKYERYNR